MENPDLLGDKHLGLGDIVDRWILRTQADLVLQREGEVVQEQLLHGGAILVVAEVVSALARLLFTRREILGGVLLTLRLRAGLLAAPDLIHEGDEVGELFRRVGVLGLELRLSCQRALPELLLLLLALVGCHFDGGKELSLSLGIGIIAVIIPLFGIDEVAVLPRKGDRLDHTREAGSCAEAMQSLDGLAQLLIVILDEAIPKRVHSGWLSGILSGRLWTAGMG